jgi:hypothetical protein
MIQLKRACASTARMSLGSFASPTLNVGDEARAGRVLDIFGVRHHFGHITRIFAPGAKQIDLEDERVP